MSHLLDTNVCIALMNGRIPGVRERFRECRKRGEEVLASTITVFELEYGIAKSAPHRQSANRQLLRSFLAGLTAIVPFDDEDARAAARIREHLRSAGTPIGPYDLLIAAQAAARDLTVVTANTGEFSRVPGIRLEDWQVL